ncbi:hypothetical protein [Prevotella sp. Rep29]|uniref:tellurite resistance TerB family protein n=1 Tax=Prevotella sp. Rep29 TaxID=2691580 RepID=UPI001C6E9E30|nr:hypothetical protein [Prevotella sp. Rep29]MBR1655955.1 hypothetical protein [Prevotella sp.]QYR10775.1 hypothetical protein GRF55_06595 [Prevotella sp. Rep29]
MEKINEKRKMQFLELYSMVMADGIVHPKEMETLYRIGVENYGLTEEEIDESVKDSGVSSFIPELPEERITFLYQMALIAWADGELEESERKMLHRYASKYGVDENSVEKLIDFLLEKAHDNVEEEKVIKELNETEI